jgi:hypothetical protein
VFWAIVDELDERAKEQQEKATRDKLRGRLHKAVGR